MATLRERQVPLKQQYQGDPESGKIVMAVRSITAGNDPTRSCRPWAARPGSIPRSSSPTWAC